MKSLMTEYVMDSLHKKFLLKNGDEGIIVNTSNPDYLGITHDYMIHSARQRNQRIRSREPRTSRK